MYGVATENDDDHHDDNDNDDNYIYTYFRLIRFVIRKIDFN